MIRSDPSFSHGSLKFADFPLTSGIFDVFYITVSKLLPIPTGFCFRFPLLSRLRHSAKNRNGESLQLLEDQGIASPGTPAFSNPERIATLNVLER